MLAPISLNGSITRDIGLFDNEESPIKLALIPSPETKPSIRRMPVPEFPRSNSSEAFINELDLFVRMTLLLFFVIDAPILFSAFKVELGSYASKKPSISISQFNNDPIIRILCEMDLSPGQIISPSKCFVGFDSRFKIYLL